MLSALREVVIVASARTPIGSFGGALASLTAPDLGASAISAAISRAGIDGALVDEAFMGNVLSAGMGQAPTRQAVLAAGLPLSVPCTTINKVCASGLKSVMLAAQSIALGQNDCVVAGGMESMSNVPYYLDKARTGGYRYGHGSVIDGIVKDGLWDAYNDFHMGMCAEACASEYGLTREAQDDNALDSYARAAAAWEAGRFSDEVCPVTVPNRSGDIEVAIDEEFSRVKRDRVKGLKPAFKKDGSVTAANASSLNDGAAAIVLMSAQKAEETGVTPIARILGFGDAAQEPIKFTTAPALAVPRALEMAGLAATDVDYHEINEAFAAVTLVNMQLQGLDWDRVNVNGGAVALGHPIGASGARILVSLLSVLQQRDASTGCASICNGGGGASALVLERL